jgi:hypothetical protein
VQELCGSICRDIAAPAPQDETKVEETAFGEMEGVEQEPPNWGGIRSSDGVAQWQRTPKAEGQLESHQGVEW